jgi:hypothetical protein
MSRTMRIQRRNAFLLPKTLANVLTWALPESPLETIVDRRRRDCCFCVGHTNLIQTTNDVAGGVEAFDGRLLMFVDEKAP